MEQRSEQGRRDVVTAPAVPPTGGRVRDRGPVSASEQQQHGCGGYASTRGFELGHEGLLSRRAEKRMDRPHLTRSTAGRPGPRDARRAFSPLRGSTAARARAPARAVGGSRTCARALARRRCASCTMLANARPYRARFFRQPRGVQRVPALVAPAPPFAAGWSRRYRARRAEDAELHAGLR